MNKILLYALLLSLFAHTSGCQRRNVTRSAGTIAQSGEMSPRPSAPDSTATGRPQPDTSVAGRPAPTGEEVRASVAEVNFQYLTARAKLSFKSPNEDLDNATLNVRVRQDSVIWLSVSKVGIEAVRALITRDSVFVIDKIHRLYSATNFSALSRQFNFPMSFALLQAFLVGNPPLPRQPAQLVSSEPDYLLLRQTQGDMRIENYVDKVDHKLKKLLITQPSTDNTLRLDYQDFTSLNDVLFPYTSLMTLDYKTKADGQPAQTLVQIRHGKVELNSQSPGFPFNVPASYRRQP